MASIVHGAYARPQPPSAVAEDRNQDNVTPLKICASFCRPPSAVAGDRNIGTNGTGVGCPQVAAILRDGR
jgi:hypothetical protein